MIKSKKIRWEVQMWTLCDGWVNTWHEDDTSWTFPSRQAAAAELKTFLADIKEAVKCGDMDSGYDRDEFRIVPAGTPDDTDAAAIIISRGSKPKRIKKRD